MEFLTKLILQTKAHLQGLTLSQRLAITSCAGMIALSIFWLLGWAGKTEMVALFDQNITAEEMGPIKQQLDAEGVKYTVSGNRVLVPADNVMRLQARLAQSDALPRDISYTFSKIIENANPWISHDEQDKRWNVALANELSLRLRHFSGVQDARVFLDRSVKRTIGTASTGATASIQVTMTSGKELDKAQARAMASFVSRAIAGLDISNVQVTDTSGRTFSMPRQDEAIGEDDLEARQKKENYFAGQIRELLENIPNLRVAVRAEMDARATQVTETKHGKAPVTKEKTKELETTEGKAGNEPGTVANTGTPNTVAAGAGSHTTETESETSFDATQDVTQTNSTMRAHRLVSLSAAINIPRSFLAGIYKAANGGKDPSDDELEAANTTKNVLNKVRGQVETLMLKADEASNAKSQVTVAWFHDNATLVMGGGAGGSGGAGEPARAMSGDSMMQYVQTYGGKAGLGALAIMSLFMMLMMVRRVGEGPVLPGEQAPPESVSAGRGTKFRKRKQDQKIEEFEVSDAPIGEAEVTEHLLVGREVDGTTLRSQKLVEQVSELIKQDPGTTVSVLQHWIDAEQG